MPKKQPIHKELNEFSRIMDGIIADLSAKIRQNLNADGSNVAAAVDKAVNQVGYVEAMRAGVSESATALMARAVGGTELVNAEGMREWWLNKKWPGDEMTLSGKINDLARMKEIKSSIRLGFREKRAWTGTARELAKRNLQSADLAKHITRLEQSARRLIGGDPGAMVDYRRDLKRAMRHVKRLQDFNAPRDRLRKAYNNVIRQAENRSIQGLDKAMDRAIRAKANYNSERVARTEMARAHSQGVYQAAMDDGDVIGLKYDLSANHDIFDICDFHTKSNQFGMGPGSYPLKALPPYPFHPHCGCQISEIYEGEATPRGQDKGKAAGWVRKQTPRHQRELMGKKGVDAFRRNPNTWENSVRGYQGHRTIETLRVRKGIKAKGGA